jgi:hypothetical protein
MSRQNSQVRFPDDLPVFMPVMGLGQITAPQPMIKIEEGVGAFAGTGLLVGGLILKGAPGIIMAVFGGLVVAISGFSVLSRLSTAPAAAAAAAKAAPPPPPPPAKPTTAQRVEQYAQAYAPAAEKLLTSLTKLF